MLNKWWEQFTAMCTYKLCELFDQPLTWGWRSLKIFVSLSNMDWNKQLTSLRRFHSLIWGNFGLGTDGSAGRLVGGGENGTITVYNPDVILASGEDVIVGQATKHTGPVRALDYNPFQVSTNTGRCWPFLFKRIQCQCQIDRVWHVLMLCFFLNHGFMFYCRVIFWRLGQMILRYISGTWTISAILWHREQNHR